MKKDNFSLQIALVWRGTVQNEQMFTRTSDPVVTVGEGDDSAFSAPALGLPDAFEMFEREDDGYVLRVTDRLDGTVTSGGERRDLQTVIEERGVVVDSVHTEAGGARVFEIALGHRDWGLLELGDNELYFQVTDEPGRVAGRGLDGDYRPLAGMVGAVALAHLLFLGAAFLFFDLDADLERRQIPDKFVDFDVSEVDDPPDKQEKETPSEGTTAKKAGGEEGEFGEEDAELEDSEVPDNDADMVEEVDPENVGVHKALGSKQLGGGAVEKMLSDQGGLDSKLDVAMSGDADSLQVGRGHEGLGTRGTGQGGGGDDGSYGQIGGVGEGDTGSGETGASLGGPDKRKIKDPVEDEPQEHSKYCDESNIQRVVKRKARRFKHCYQKELQKNPELKGKVVAQWKIGLDGDVTSKSVVESTFDNGAVESCITRVIGQMRFSEPDGGICVVQYPFVFTGIE